MATFGAVLVLGRLGSKFHARAPDIGLVARTSALPGADLWVSTGATSANDNAAAATKISTIADGQVMGLYGHDGLDVYEVLEARQGEIIRSLFYVRDDGGWKLNGTAQPWEADFHFALSLEEYGAVLDASGWYGRDVTAARTAYSARDVSLLQRRPPPDLTQIVRFVQKLGFDWKAGPHAHWRPRGVVGRLLGL